MHHQNERGSGVTYIGPRSFAILFCAICATFAGVFWAFDRTIETPDPPVSFGVHAEPAGTTGVTPAVTPHTTLVAPTLAVDHRPVFAAARVATHPHPREAPARVSPATRNEIRRKASIEPVAAGTVVRRPIRTVPSDARTVPLATRTAAPTPPVVAAKVVPAKPSESVAGAPRNVSVRHDILVPFVPLSPATSQALEPRRAARELLLVATPNVATPVPVGLPTP